MEPLSHEARDGVFRTTRWSVVLRAGDLRGEAAGALETLCGSYWYPLYVFVRRRGFSAHEAQDLTQEFFARLLAGQALQSVDPAKGRFRTFLLASIKHFLAKEWRDANRIKRGGGYQFLSWEGFDPEERYRLEPEAGHTAEQGYDRHWAHTVVGHAVDRLEKEMRREGNGARFEVLKPYLQNDGSGAGYAEAALKLDLSEPGVKSGVHRLRRRYAEIIREDISHTVGEKGEVEKEIQYLISILAR